MIVIKLVARSGRIDKDIDIIVFEHISLYLVAAGDCIWFVPNYDSGAFLVRKLHACNPVLLDLVVDTAIDEDT